MAFFRNEPITDVVRRLNLSADDEAGMNLLEQEVWGILLTYNLIRREPTRASEKHKKAPLEINFRFALQFIATEMITLENTL